MFPKMRTSGWRVRKPRSDILLRTVRREKGRMKRPTQSRIGKILLFMIRVASPQKIFLGVF